MNTFVKIKGHSNWFMLINNSSELPKGIEEQSHEAIKKRLFNDLIHSNNQKDAIAKLKIISSIKPNYSYLADRSDSPLLIRQIGSYMYLRETDEIQEQVVGNGFPTGVAEIAICENDENLEKHWVQYLSKRFPDKTIKTINFFDIRTVEDLKEQLKGVKYVTFFTTFTNVGWFKNLLEAISPEQELIGYCHYENGWEKALPLVESKGLEIEIVNSIS